MSHLGLRVIQVFYSRLSWAYEPAVWLISGGLWNRWAAVAERFVAGQPVLELGCGRGRLLARLAGRGVDVIGIDQSPQMVRASRRRLARAGLPGRVLCSPAQDLPLPDGSVGTIVCAFPSAYMHDERSWTRCARVLRPGGPFVVVPGLRLDRVPLRLAGMYPFMLLRHGLRRPRRGPDLPPTPPWPVPTQHFPDRKQHAVQVGPASVWVIVYRRA